MRVRIFVWKILRRANLPQLPLQLYSLACLLSYTTLFSLATLHLLPLVLLDLVRYLGIARKINQDGQSKGNAD